MIGGRALRPLWNWSYAESLPALLQRQAEVEQARRSVDDMVEHPERVRPDQFSYEVLNRIFHRHSGPGPGTLKVGGWSD